MKTAGRVLGLLVLLLHCACAQAQIEFKARANKQEVGRYEKFTVSFRVNASAKDFAPPDFKNFEVLSGPNTSFSSTFINGQYSQNETYSYYLRPRSVGTFAIGPASVSVKGKTYRTEPLVIKVVAQSRQAVKPNSIEAKARKLSFLEVVVDKTSVYLGEPLVARYLVYYKTNISRPEIIDEPTYREFYREDISGDLAVDDATYQGERMKKVRIDQKVLIPQQAGSISPGKLTVKVPTRIPTNRVDFFGRRVYQNADNYLERQFPLLKVKPLPKSGKPAAFDGAVGQFDFAVKVSRGEVGVNESFTLTLRLTGIGNFPLFDLPRPDLPSVFEVFDPKSSSKVKAGLNGLSGTKVYEYVIVPRYSGTYKIPSISFSFFDPAREAYQTLRSPEIPIEVTGSEPPPSGGAAIAGNNPSPGKQDVSYLNRDILFIKTAAEQWQLAQDEPFVGSARYRTLWMIWALLLLAVGAAYGLRKNRRKNEGAWRTRQASRRAQKELKVARRAAQEQNRPVFFEALSTALWGYLAQKLALPPSEISKDMVQGKLRERAVPKEQIEALLDLLESAEMARYASFDKGELMEDYRQAAAILTEIEKFLGK